VNTTTNQTLQERFDDKWTPEPYSGCWLWTAARSPSGYGRIGIGGRAGNARQAHRISWGLHRGEIPKGKEVCHRCDTPSCVNPDHLFLGSHQENMRDAVQKGRTSKGEHRPLAKLSEGQVEEIRASTESQRVLAGRYGVCQQHISEVKSGSKWSHL